MRGSWILVALVVLGAGWLVRGADDPPAKPPKPPEGWKEYRPKDRAFTVWLPKGGKRTERSDMVFIKNRPFRVNAVEQETENKGTFIARTILVPPQPPVGGIPVESWTEIIRDAFLEKYKGGKVADEDEVKRGDVTGKEYKVAIDEKRSARLRVYATGFWIHEVAVVGSKEQVEGKDADTFFDSYRLPTDPVHETDFGLNGETGVIGFGLGIRFRDPAPDDGILVGFEIWVKDPGDNAYIPALRPIYRIGDKEVLGAQYGKRFDTKAEKPVIVKAKAGYAIGAITGKDNLVVCGFSVTFMKVTKDGLDSDDQYTVDWVGGKQGNRVKRLESDGRFVTGIHGIESGPGDLAGLGLVLQPSKGAPKK